MAVALTVLLVLPLSSDAQSRKPGSVPFAESDRRAALVNGCESNRFRLEDVNGFAGKDNSIILIARLGVGEKSAKLSHRRLHNARIYLRKFLLRDPKSIIVAAGERVNGRGRMEVYVGGKLVEAFGMGSGEDFYIGTCEYGSLEDKDFYDSRKNRKK